jgi:FkbM family methyltransferase
MLMAYYFLTELIRKLIRRLQIHWMLEPFIRQIEDIQIARLGDYRVQRTSHGSIKYTYRRKSVEIRRASEDFCRLAMSRWGRPTLSAVLHCVSDGMIVWDVGANNGFYSCLLSEVTGQTGAVFAFEPNPGLFQEFECHLVACGATNVRLLPVALSNVDGTAQMLVNQRRTSVSRIVDGKVVGSGDERIVRVSTLCGDSVLKQGVAGQPAFIKLDVEGHELNALQGMQKVLSSSELRAVLCEIHFALLEENGAKNASYQIRRLLRHCGLMHQQWVSRSHLLARR